ncbi:cullin-9-like [Mixophyes fleayi]|uniref:cullin-9-like n=1 Tax=Mixophyes fleayi TaxID=3061075 RepID=UPI003F4DD525
MFILLLFNQQKEVSEKDIVHCTGVSDSLLRNSLLPLTADSGILTVHETTRRLCLNETALSDRQMEALLNLSPKQTYMSDSERSICALKEKRDFLSHIISQVMKEEREIHVDLLVFRVMESCQKQEDTLFLLSPSHKYVATDVLSCIMRQLRDGKIQKKQSDPLILCYKVENPPRPAFYPITPHTNNVMNIPPQVSEFCRVQKVTSNIAPVQENRPTFSTFKNTEKP